jgi:hypothetical protein
MPIAGIVRQATHADLQEITSILLETGKSSRYDSTINLE